MTFSVVSLLAACAPNCRLWTMHKRWGALLSFALGCVATTHALDPKLSVAQYAQDVWGRRDGVPATVVQSLAQSPDGYLWVGTPAGLVRFDGASFTEVPTNPQDAARREYISTLAVAPDGALWIGTKFDGVRVYRNRRITPSEISRAEPNVHGFLFDRTGALYIATPNGLSRVNADETLTPLNAKDSYVRAVTSDAAGRIWAGSYTGVSVFEHDQRVSEMSLNDAGIEVMMTDRSGRVWIGGFKGLTVLAKGNVAGARLDDYVLTERVQALLEDHDGNIWVGTINGLVRIAAGTTTVRDGDRMPMKQVLSLLEDKEGSLWVGTGEGLHRLKNVNVVPWNKTEGIISDETASIITDRLGSVYVLSSGAGSGVSRIREGKVTPLVPVVDGPSYVDENNVLWVSSTGRVSRIEGDVIRNFSTADGLLPYWSSVITGDEQSLILCYGRLGGVCRWRDGKMEPYRFRDGKEFTAPYHVMSAHKTPDGTIWMAGYDGLWCIKDGDITRYVTSYGMESTSKWYADNPQSKEYFRTVVADTMADYWFTAIDDDGKGTLWIASQRGGLTRLRDGVFSAITTKQGLPTNQLYSVLVDREGDVWMSTPRGLVRASGRQLDEVIAGKRATLACDVFTTDDGMKTEEGNHAYQPSGYRAADGKLWFVTKHGAVSVDPVTIKRNPTVPPVYVEDVIVDGAKLDLAAEAKLSAGREKIEFHYTALSLLAPERVRFKYQLEGYDEHWVDASSRRVAHYTKLPPGRYRFRVTGCNNDGVWNDAGASYSFTLQPFFYQTVWFWGLCVGAAVGSGLGLHRWRVRHLRARELLLQSRVEQRTAELSQANDQLKHQIAERERAQREIDRIHQELMIASRRAGMAEVATGVLHNVGNVLNSVNVTTAVLAEQVHNSRAPTLSRVSQLLKEHKTDLANFLVNDARGKLVPEFIDELATVIVKEQTALLKEMDGLKQNIDHIRDIVMMQQNYATVSGVAEVVAPALLVEDALKMNAAALSRHSVTIIREFEADVPQITTDKHKVLQILVNLIQNAKYACDESPKEDKRIVVRVAKSSAGVRIQIADNGVGIPAENRLRIFNHGFTTRKTGHGFGLHSGALAAKELGGSLSAQSDGVGQGATFTLDLPISGKS